MADISAPAYVPLPTELVEKYKDMGDGTWAKIISAALSSGVLPAALGQAVMASSLPVAIASNQSTLPVTETPARNSGVLHRDAITVVDKLIGLANTDITVADNGPATGSLNASTTYKSTVIAGNRWGSCQVATTINSGPATAADGLNTHSLRLTFLQVTGADYYDIFLSTDAAPLWVARVTEAQRAAGDYEVTAVGTVAAGGGNPAGSIDVNVVGTGQATSVANFKQNNAYRPDNAAIVAISCAGRSQAIIHVKLSVTDLRSAPALSVIPFFANQVSAADWHQGSLATLNVLNALGQSLEQAFVVDVNGATGLKILIDSISGQGAAASVWVELA